MKRIDLIEELKEPGYKVALVTSYSTDLLFFEKMILRHFIEQNCTYLGLFVDQKCLFESITKPNISELGKSYIIKGMETNHAFHPKVYLLLGEHKAKVLIGSGNLTPAGFITNHEVFNRFTIDTVGREYEYLAEIQAAFQLFQSFNKEHNNKMWQELFSKTKEFSYLMQDTARESSLLTNQEQSMQEQLNQFIPNGIKEIECFVPYFDQSLSLIKEWNERYQPEQIKIYLQNKHTNFPRHLLLESNISLYQADFLEESHKRYHGKVFRFIGESTEVIIYGSGNCSRQAFLLNSQFDGNSEAIVVEVGEKGEFDHIFEKCITLTPLPIPLPEDFRTIEEDVQGEIEKEPFRIYFIDGILRDQQLFITLKTDLLLKSILLEDSIEGVLAETNGNVFTYVFNTKTEPLSPVLSLIGYTKERSISFMGWYHDTVSLQNTFHNMKKSVHFQLPNDPYLEDYHNIVALLDDLQNRLILTERDIDETEQTNTRMKSIHAQAELSQVEEYVSSNPDDYYTLEETDVAYGSIGNVDVIGNLIRILLKGFYEESAETIKSTSEKFDSNLEKLQTVDIPKDLREKLQKRMKNFMTKYNKGINSERYLENIEPDIMIKNMTIYLGFLNLLEQKLGEHFLTKNELVLECFEVVKALEHYSQNNILDMSREDMQMLLIHTLGTIAAEGYILEKTEDNYHILRNEKKKLGQLLKNIHKQIHPIGKNIHNYSIQISLLLQRKFGIDMDKEAYEQSFHKMFPLLSFEQLVSKIRSMDITVKKIPLVDEPDLCLEREVKLTPEFHHKQLNILAEMLAVEEWEETSAFKIRWFNVNPEMPVQRFVLYYNQKKRVLKRKYVYKQRDREPYIEQKNNVYKHQLISAAERGDTSIICEGFRTK